MATVFIPVLMRDLTGGQERVIAGGRTVAQVIEALDADYPGIKARLCEGEHLVPGVAVAVDGVVRRLGLRAPVKADSILRFLPAVEGG